MYPAGWQTDLDIVTVGIEHKRAVIVRMVVRTYSGEAIVPAAGGDGFPMKPVDGGLVRRGKGDMRAGLRRVSSSDPEEGLGSDAIAREAFAFRIQARDPQRTQGAIVEFLRLLDDADADGDVIQHISDLSASSSPAGARCAPAAS